MILLKVLRCRELIVAHSNSLAKQSKIVSLEQELLNALSENQKIKDELNKVIEKKKKSNVKKTVCC
jgi:hypothetical protein